MLGFIWSVRTSRSSARRTRTLSAASLTETTCMASSLSRCVRALRKLVAFLGRARAALLLSASLWIFFVQSLSAVTVLDLRWTGPGDRKQPNSPSSSSPLAEPGRSVCFDARAFSQIRGVQPSNRGWQRWITVGRGRHWLVRHAKFSVWPELPEPDAQGQLHVDRE